MNNIREKLVFQETGKAGSEGADYVITTSAEFASQHVQSESVILIVEGSLANPSKLTMRKLSESSKCSSVEVKIDGRDTIDSGVYTNSQQQPPQSSQKNPEKTDQS